MALKRKAKKKLKTQASGASGSSGVESSPLRPYQLEKDPPCANNCPQGTEVRKILMTIAQAEKYEKTREDSFNEAWEIFTNKNPMPAVCGCVCPHPCETNCNRAEMDGPLSVNDIEKFIGEWGLKNNLKLVKLTEEKHPETVAVVGAGPAGLCCAYHLARNGYDVTIFESFSKAGGMLRYGIPAYRLPHETLDGEIQNILDLGVELKTNTIIGKDITYEELQESYDAIFIGIGAHKGKKLWCEGEDAENVYSGVNFLHLANTGKPVELGDKVVVIGGGDTAIDAARVALRLGATVTLLYRRTRNEMPAIEEEIVGAEDENITFHFLAAPAKIYKENGRAVRMNCQRMELGEPDSSGRRRPVPIEGDTFDIEVTSVIAAISQEPDFDNLEMLREGKDWVKADKHGVTSIEKSFAGGDVLDLALVTDALSHGKIAADAIHASFRGIEPENAVEKPVIGKDRIVFSHYEEAKRHDSLLVDPDKRFEDPWAEIRSTLSPDDIVAEAKRCLSCGDCFDCGTCWSFCQDNAIVKPLISGQPYKFKLEFCNGCNKCKEVCPCGYIEMK